MKTRFLVIWMLVFAISYNINAQEKSKKELKAEQRVQREKTVTDLIETETFVFHATFVQPLGTRDLNIDGQNYSVTYKPDLVDSYLPFFGRGYNIGYNGDSGMTFKGKPQDYKVTKKKKFYLITTTVKGENDVYDLSLSVYFEGNASLTINSNNRNSISYTGRIEAVTDK